MICGCEVLPVRVRSLLGLALWCAACGASESGRRDAPSESQAEASVEQDSSMEDVELPDAELPPEDAPEPPPEDVPQPPPPEDVPPVRDVMQIPDVSPVRDVMQVPDVPVEPPPMGSPRLVQGLEVTSVALFQTVRVGLVTNGAAVTNRNAPVVLGRAGVLRAYVRPAAGFTARALTAELLWSTPAGTRVLRDTKTIAAESREAAPSSLFQFSLTPADIVAGARYSVRVIDPAAAPVADGVSNNARFPRDGMYSDLNGRADNGGVLVVLVPLQWNADGSGRVPDTSETHLNRIRSLLLALYPTTSVELRLHAPVPWSGGLTFTRSVDLGDINDMLISLRRREMPPAHAYYYAMVAPSATRAGYRGSTTGQAYVVTSPANADYRVGSGVSWGDDFAAGTLAHELGHMHGRSHAPCDVSRPDPNYPYAGGRIGVWGWDVRDGSFRDPAMGTDFMGYCDYEWASDYTYRGLFDRIVALNATRTPFTTPGTTTTATRVVRSLRLLRDGSVRWGLQHEVDSLPPETEAVRFLDANGSTLHEGIAGVLHDEDGEERVLLLPRAPVGATSVETASGVRHALPVESR